MLSLQEISDRLEIERLSVQYANAIDMRKFDELDNVFTPDAYIDYRKMDGIDGRYPEIKAWLPPALSRFPSYYHMMGNFLITVTGDTATGRVTCYNPMVVDLGNGKTQVGLLGLWYVDKYVRTPKGWRICERVEERGYAHNFPGMG